MDTQRKILNVLKVLIIGHNEIVEKNLELLGLSFTIWDTSMTDFSLFDGIIVLDANRLSYATQHIKTITKIPVIASTNCKKIYKYYNSDIVIFDENEVSKIFKSNSLEDYKEELKKYNIKYMVVSLGKEKIKKIIRQELPKIKIENVNITKEKVDNAKSVITAIITSIYLKTKKLSTNAINQANIGASLSVVSSSNLKDFYLKIKRK